MIILLLRLFNIRDYEVCQSCETLKQQLSYERDEKARLTETLLNIIQPKAFEAPPVMLNEIKQTSALFSRRRAALEEKDRQEAQILREAKNLGKPDISFANQKSESDNRSINNLEAELGIEKEA